MKLEPGTIIGYNDFFTQANDCVNYVTKEEFEKKAIKGAIQTDKKEIMREKEIIREKEVIVKIRCRYCKNLYEETLDKCPHCGGSN